MTDKPDQQLGPEDEQSKRTAVRMRYGGASQVVTTEGTSCLALFSDLGRKTVRAEGQIKQPVDFREMFSTLYDVVRSDFRYVPRDRTAYLAYMRMRKQTAGMDVWQAQQAYFDWMSRNDPNAWLILDPVVTVHPDALMFEVFSKDEGTYAKLDIDWSAVDLEGDLECGTTSIDYSKALFDGVQRLRSYRESRLSIGRQAVALATKGEEEVVEKNIQVPDTWLRGFLQVQSAATLPRTVFQIAAIDLYNVLRQLRMQRDQKKGGRGIRIELSPGEPPRLVLEPWETVINTGAGKYTGRVPGVIRIWGRRRLMLLQRMLPLVDTIDIHVLGSGLPSFYVLRAGAFTMTLGLSGFTASNWAQAVSFDLLLPRGATDRAKQLLGDIANYLQDKWRASAAEIAKALGKEPKDVLQALQLGCQHGQIMYDLARDIYRLRPLVGAELNLDRLQFRNKRERVAHDLLAGDHVSIVSENRIHGVGLELTGKVVVAADKREYRPVIRLDDDGRVRKAECTCNFYRKHKLKEGPCAHLIALRLCHAREEERRRSQRDQKPDDIAVETRTFARRRGATEEVFQVSLERKRLKLRWGPRGQAVRVQSMVFNSAADARVAYFERVARLQARGYLDATSG